MRAVTSGAIFGSRESAALRLGSGSCRSRGWHQFRSRLPRDHGDSRVRSRDISADLVAPAGAVGIDPKSAPYAVRHTRSASEAVLLTLIAGRGVRARVNALLLTCPSASRCRTDLPECRAIPLLFVGTRAGSLCSRHSRHGTRRQRWPVCTAGTVSRAPPESIRRCGVHRVLRTSTWRAGYCCMSAGLPSENSPGCTGSTAGTGRRRGCFFQ